MKLEKIIAYRTTVGNRIDRRFGAFTHKANILHEENTRRMLKELKSRAREGKL